MLAEFFKIILLVAVLASNSACSSARSHERFPCSAAKGANCVSLGQIDQMITSGQIKEYTDQAVKPKCCSGASCRKFGPAKYKTKHK